MVKIIFIIAVTVFAVIPASAVAAAKPNIIVILADDLGYADVGYHQSNDVSSPNIDRLAKNGSYFSAGYAMAPVCGPSRAGLLTGRYQNRFGFEDNPGGPFRQNSKVKPGIPKSEVNLGEQLQSLGYATAWIGKDHQGKDEDFHPNNRGFERFFGFIDGASTYYTSTSKKQKLQRDKQPLVEGEYLTDAFGREAVSFIKENAKNPFFLYLPFNAVHGPLEAKPEDLAKFSHVQNKARRTMLAMHHAMDRSIGLVYNTLEQLNLVDNTLIVFYSDNGGKPIKGHSGNASLNTPLKGQKGSLLEGGIRVPFLMHWPKRIAANNRVDFPVAAIDVFPTVLAATGDDVKPGNKLDGINLLPYLTEELKAPAGRNLYWRFLYQWAVRDNDWKLVKLKGVKQPELYHLSKDISEQHNVAKQFPQIVKRLEQQFNTWSARMMQPQWSWQARFGGNYNVNKAKKIINKG
ncbi:sulfatase-like hydrolase/transferase [Thalassotalea fonticola]|uniref:Sulfatase-like hydrolase/transferase n=1 Tax=Thalassotalea fonticola TaxID=3065649 RepID=A0ABZ0GSC7_9GAMM|nr:sulfatase-like hydrolase/transferase [Colwelliaceae bacterium S1-1]